MEHTCTRTSVPKFFLDFSALTLTAAQTDERRSLIRGV